MNMEQMRDNIRHFTREIIDSGFKRDIDDYLSSLPSHQSNIITLRDIAKTVLAALEKIYESDMPDALRSLLPTGAKKPFTETPHNEFLQTLVNDTQIQLPDFFSQLQKRLTQLKSQLTDNQSALNDIQQFIAPYISEDEERIAAADLAIISIIFKERNTITQLKQLASALVTWNRTLPIYHQLLKSESPKDIEIVEVEHGSIDLVINLNIDVALNLVELFDLGFKVFAAYLSYKKMIEPLVASYHGNKKLIELDREKEVLMLENIGKAIHCEIVKQHKAAKKADSKVDATAIDKKVELVEKLITSHIVKGNDIRLLAVPEKAEQNSDPRAMQSKIEAYRKTSTEARQLLRQMPQGEQQKLLEAYGSIPESQELDIA